VPGELGSESLRVLLESGAVEGGVERLELVLGHEVVVLDPEKEDLHHHTVGNGDLVASDEVCTKSLKLSLAASEEGFPLLREAVIPHGVLGGLALHAGDEDLGRPVDSGRPGIHDPVNSGCGFPVLGVVVSFLNTDGSENGDELADTLAFEAHDGEEEAKLVVGLATHLLADPAGDADEILGEVTALVVEHGAQRLDARVHSFEVFEANLVDGERSSRGTTAHSFPNNLKL